MKSLGIINTNAPYGTSHGQEALDLAMASATFGQAVSLFFVSDGVFQLLKHQQPDTIEHKNYSKTFAALEFYDIENIYVCADSLSERNLTASDLCIEVAILSQADIQLQMNKLDNVLSF